MFTFAYVDYSHSLAVWNIALYSLYMMLCIYVYDNVNRISNFLTSPAETAKIYIPINHKLKFATRLP